LTPRISERVRAPPPVGRRAQRDAVAFAVDDDCTKAVRADRLRRLDDAPPELLDLSHRVAHPAVRVQVDKDA